MRTIGVVTVGRSDYTICRPILRRINDDPELRLHLIVAGMHLAPEFGLTVNTITAEGFTIAERVELLRSSDTPEGIANSIGLGVIGFARAYARTRPDLLVVAGDRFEMHAAALAALPFTIPVAHVHGGELTEGAFDDALRHSLTKLSHLHFVSTEAYARRVLQMGEEPWRVLVSGAPSLETLRTTTLLDRRELERRFGLRLDGAPLVVTYHPVTLEYADAERQIRQLLEALEAFELPIVFTPPNADTQGRVIRRAIEAFVAEHPAAQLVENFGPQGYFSLMALAAAMVGNSSSGLVEAPSFGLPVVNIGTRQDGRIRAANVIDVGYHREEIIRAIRQVLGPAFRSGLRGQPNPYGDGHAAEIIASALQQVPLGDSLIRKRFVDHQPDPSPAAHEGISIHAG